jgi:hypothetical protein
VRVTALKVALVYWRDSAKSSALVHLFSLLHSAVEIAAVEHASAPVPIQRLKLGLPLASRRFSG